MYRRVKTLFCFKIFRKLCDVACFESAIRQTRPSGDLARALDEPWVELDAQHVCVGMLLGELEREDRSPARLVERVAPDAAAHADAHGALAHLDGECDPRAPVVGHGNLAAAWAVNYRDRTAPVALAREAPVAQPEIHLPLGNGCIAARLAFEEGDEGLVRLRAIVGEVQVGDAEGALPRRGAPDANGPVRAPRAAA